MVIEKEWFTVEEAAAYLSVSRRTIYKLTEEGRLPVFKISRQRIRRFRKEDLDKVPRQFEVKESRESYSLNEKEDPVLAEVWKNEKDSAYDTL